MINCWRKFSPIAACCVAAILLSVLLLRPFAVNAEEQSRVDATILRIDQSGRVDVIRPDGARAKFEWNERDEAEPSNLTNRLKEFVQGDVRVISHPEAKTEFVAEIVGLFDTVTISADDDLAELSVTDSFDDGVRKDEPFHQDNAEAEYEDELFDEEDRESDEGEEASADTQRGVDRALRKFDAAQSQRLEELRQRIEQKLTQQLERRHQRQMEMIERERQRLHRLEGQIRQQMERRQEMIQLQTEAALDRVLSAGGLAELDEPAEDFGHFGDEADRVRGRKNEYEQARSEILRNQYASLSAQYERQKAEIDELRQMMEQTANRRDKELLRANLELQRQRQSALQETTRAISDELRSQLRASRDKLENPPTDRHPEPLEKINQQLAEVESQIAKATADVKRNEATLKKLAAEMKLEESDQHIPDRLVRSYLIRQHSSRSRLDELLQLIDDLRIQRWELHKQQDKLRQRNEDGKTQPADDGPNDLDDLFDGR